MTGNVEVSFASKLLATLKTEMPIWDRYVVQNLNIKVPSASDSDRIQNEGELYAKINDWYTDFLKTENVCQCLSKLDEVLPDYAWLSDVKKRDQIKRIKKHKRQYLSIQDQRCRFLMSIFTIPGSSIPISSQQNIRHPVWHP